MPLTDRQAILLYRVETEELKLTPEQRAEVPGIHFCPDWDFMVICDDSPEKEACLCKIEGNDT